MEMQATDVMSGQMPLREPHSGWGRKISRQHSALGVKSSLPHRGEQWRVPRAEHRAFISPLLGGRMVANGGSVPIGDRSADACPYESEKQAEVSG